MHSVWRGLLLFVIGACASQKTTLTEQCDVDQQWREVARASHIVLGQVKLPKGEQNPLAERFKSMGYVAINLYPEQVLKGPERELYTIAVEPNYAEHDLDDLNDQRVLAFLEQGYATALFPVYGQDVLIVVDDVNADRAKSIEGEIERQTMMAQITPISQSDDNNVGVLIEQAAGGDYTALLRLIEADDSAVPEFVDGLSDFRPYPFASITLENKSPDAFEAARHYGPELMVDALAAILNQLSGEGFGFIYNGASDLERQNTIDAWRSYAATNSLCGQP